MDLAVFPNRAEGGTNLVAMEAMACGVPTILSANTGHLDLMADPQRCWRLERQRVVAPVAGFAVSTEGWGESDLDELIAAMESAWADRDAARARGLSGAQWMKTLSWTAQSQQLKERVNA
jgi:glycosyltransferase involved in cell wall biosynthesis